MSVLLRHFGGPAVLIIFALCIVVAALASVVLRSVGLGGLKRYPLETLVLACALLAVGAAGMLRVARPLTGRILTHLRYVRTPDIILPAGCTMFPADNIWNTSIRNLPLHPLSAGFVEAMGADKPVHADFGTHAGYEIAIAGANERPAEISFGEGAAESDPGPYRIPDDAPIEKGGDRHVLVVDPSHCELYELFSVEHSGSNHWDASSGAVFDLRSNKLRPRNWTSADAAGLPMIPGLVRYEEVKAGAINHALRFTTPKTRKLFYWPAQHSASSNTDPTLPPMGLRFRLKSSVPIGSFSPETRVILTALQNYGMMLADNGSAWYLSGAMDSRWPSRVGEELRKLHGSDFEAVDSTGLMISSESGQVQH
jgi:hypothetical protein